jgi:APA family basic amino acid/polyamine antiporter
MRSPPPLQRRLGIWGATAVGVGAIVGGGILALTGIACASAGPSAIVAFALNGVIAVLTALSFAEMSAAFPESGGAYTFAKKVLSVRAAFTIGWVVWFASIVAGVLYALGFAVYAVRAVTLLWWQPDAVPAWFRGSSPVTVLAASAVLFYALALLRKAGGGRQWATVGKVAVFAVLIVGGLAALGRESPDEIRRTLSPFFAGGAAGLFQAMGYTFIAMQGFDLISAVAGEVREPGRTIPLSMLLSLAIALIIYLPLLLVIATVGVPDGTTIVTMSRRSPETVVADAARHYLGPSGFWLVMIAAVLSMLSALQANLLASSRVAQAMARDRTLPSFLEPLHGKRGTPGAAIGASSAGMVLLLLVIQDVAVAGAVSSLIFLVCFALAHGTSVLARLRAAGRSFPFRTPWFPLVPLVGGTACAALAMFQAIAVPRAGIIGAVWIAIGGVIFLRFLVRRATIFDASTEALDPGLVQLRGRSPLVLVPIANPASAGAMVAVANALAPSRAGRVLLLNVVSANEENWAPDSTPRQILDSQQVLRESLLAAFRESLVPEALTTVAPRPWPEIIRVARIHRCASLLLGFSKLSEDMLTSNLELVISEVNCDVSVLRASQGWHPAQARRILVPVGGRSEHDVLRARLLGSLNRMGPKVITFLRVLPHDASAQEYERARDAMHVLARDEAPAASEEILTRSENAAAEVIRAAAACDLIVLGLQRLSRHQKVFGNFTLRIARETQCPLIMISRRG